MNLHVRTILSVGLVLAVVSCQETPTTPSGEMATFTAELSPANEIPPVGLPESTGSGTVTITFNITRDSGGAITAAVASFTTILSGFPAGTALTMAHIHRGGVGVPGPIVVDTGLAPGQVVLTTGSGSFNRSGIAVSATLAQEILSTPAAFYFNVHSVLNPDGVVRGQLIRQ